MKHVMHLRVWIAVFAATAASGCIVPPAAWTTASPGGDWTRFGTVESVQQIVERPRGDVATGAIAGALVAGYLSRGDGPSTLLGAAAGAAIGASASTRAAEHHGYRVWVRFGDGSRRAFVYDGGTPFWPGDPVVLTPRGLLHA